MLPIDVQSLEVDQRVAFARWHHWGGRPLEFGFGVVSKINRYGHVYVTVDGKDCHRVFDKYGKERKDYGATSLITPEKLQSDLDAHERDTSICRKFRELQEHLKGRTNGHGQVHPTQETADLLKALAQRIETNTWA